MAPTSAKQHWTVLKILNWTTDHFGRAGIENPRLNAELLLGKVLGVERIMLYARFEREVDEASRRTFRDLVRRRAGREPLQYLLGHCEFYGRDFEVTPAVMVPRQETELVVEAVLKRLPGDGEGAWAADVGTGSGVIAVSLAAERAGLRLVATDQGAEALEVAARNARKHAVADRIAFARGNLAEPVGPALPAGRRLAVLVSNPPYVPTGELEDLQPEVRDHEPRAALDGGTDGLDVVRRLVPQAADLLAPGGWLVLELGEGQAAQAGALAALAGTFDAGATETVRDAGGCERVLCVRKAGP
jgi:release factor glutamine methyltransferase